MLNKLFATATALTLVAATAASAITPGQAQLANAAGVTPGQFEQAQINQLLKAERDGDQARVQFILSNSGTNPSSLNSAGAAQLAASLGVEPAVYTLSELNRLAKAYRDGDTAGAAFVLSGDARPTEDLAGKQPLADYLGVNAADYTRAELVAIKADLLED